VIQDELQMGERQLSQEEGKPQIFYWELGGIAIEEARMSSRSSCSRLMGVMEHMVMLIFSPVASPNA
jgi:hypothetical protein